MGKKYMILTFNLRHSPERVFGILSDAKEFVSVHPLIYRMDLMLKGDFKVFEKVNFGRFSYSFTYQAKIFYDSAAFKVIMHAKVQRIVNIQMEFQISGQPNGCLVKEEVKIKSILPVQNYMLKLIKEQHQVLFQNIEKLPII